MAIFKRKNKVGEEGETWYVDYRDPTGKRVIKAVGPSKREAEAYLGKIKGSIREQRFFDIKKESRVTFGELLDAYEEKIKDRRSYKKTTQYFIATLRNFFSPKLLSEIDYKLIEDFRDQRKATQTKHEGERSQRSVDLELALLRTILNKGIRWNMLDRNPFDKANDLFYHPDSHRERALSEDEIKRLIESSPSYLKPIIISAIYTGLRKNDLFGLKWENVDLEKGSIHLIEAKTGKPRIIVLNKDMLSLLHGLPVRGEYLFPNKEGKPYSDLSGGLESALKKADIDVGMGRNKIVFHTLRHTCVTLLRERGADMGMVTSYIGHADEKTTQGYAHASEEYKRRTADLLNGVCFGNKVETIENNGVVSA
jgi:integrase